MPTRLPAREVIARVLDDAADLDAPAATADPLGWPGYRERLAEVRESTGTDESVVVARGRVAGTATEVVVAAWEFGFLGGSLGTVAGQRVAAAFDHARETGLPTVLLPSTGGSRMQEGMAALTQMAATSVAARRHADAGLLQVAYLRDPTTGGVFASHINLADVILAEPEATIGFAGPRVAEAMTGGPLPDASHTARGAEGAGLVDGVVALDDLPARLTALVSWPGTADPAPPPSADGERTPPGDAWEQVRRARAPGRARAGAFLAATEVAAELHGDRSGEDDPTVRVALTRLHGRPLVIVAMDREAAEGRISPAGYRKAWRGIDLADRIDVPLLTLVDTPGADASASSEAGGIASHIARTFSRLLAVRVPTVTLVIGEGGSGGALALSVTDRLLIQEHAVFSVIAPEGAAAILHRDADRAPDVAGHLRLTAGDLADLGLADTVVPEPAGAEVAAGLGAVAAALDALAGADADERLAARLDRWRDPVPLEPGS